MKQFGDVGVDSELGQITLHASRLSKERIRNISGGAEHIKVTLFGLKTTATATTT